LAAIGQVQTTLMNQASGPVVGSTYSSVTTVRTGRVSRKTRVDGGEVTGGEEGPPAVPVRAEI